MSLTNSDKALGYPDKIRVRHTDYGSLYVIKDDLDIKKTAFAEYTRTPAMEWVPCSERLPEPSGKYRSASVLAYCPSIKCTFTACYNYEHSRWEFFATGATWMPETVSHWRALPTPPETDKALEGEDG
ncbi:DUF551 domain-containing protein [uncultured Paraglaciecola sp.]|uniref:DUF551 domain-containing protein n=1 Tax=uncultured Paraglaciecola sp. TaxID=1765024 RepID=UPI0026399668|nr:DUF551 domain-containing protein [uncultured Paraglaciecola sp.]